jgi:hypothetical protein
MNSFFANIFGTKPKCNWRKTAQSTSIQKSSNKMMMKFTASDQLTNDHAFLTLFKWQN